MSVDWLMADSDECGEHFSCSHRVGLGDDGRIWMLAWSSLENDEQYGEEDWYVCVALRSVVPGEPEVQHFWGADSRGDWKNFSSACDVAEELYRQAKDFPEDWPEAILPFKVEAVL